MLTTWPSVCVVIPTFARTRLLGEAVASVLMQDYKGVISIVVVNDHPQQTLDLDEESLGEHVSALVCNANGLFPTLGAKRDFSIRKTGADWIVFLDDDDLIMPWYLTSLFAGVKPEHQAVFPKECFRFEHQRWSHGPANGGIIMAVRRDTARRIGFDKTLNMGEDQAFRSAIKSSAGDQGIYTPVALGYAYRMGTGVSRARNNRGEVDRDLFLRWAADRIIEKSEPIGDIVIEPVWRRPYLIELSALLPDAVPKAHRKTAT